MTPTLRKPLFGFVAAVVLGCCSAAMAAAPKYKLDVVRGDGAMPVPSAMVAINDEGEMIGTIYGLPDHSFTTVLARYTGRRSAAQLLPDSDAMEVAGINAAGDVLASEHGNSALWRHDGTRETLDQLDRVTAINNIGHITGYQDTAAVVWKDGVADVLEGVDGQQVWVSDINDSSVSVGTVDYMVGKKHRSDAAVWDAAGHLVRLTVAGAQDADAQSINKQGQVVGWATDGVDYFSFLYDAGIVTRLPQVHGDDIWQVVTINDHGDVLGNQGPVEGPVLWHKGVGYQLRDLLEDHGQDWQYLTAYDMNNSGQIVGWGRYKGKGHGFIAKRVKQ